MENRLSLIIKRILRKVKRSISVFLIFCMVAESTLIYAHADDFNVESKELVSDNGSYVIDENLSNVEPLENHNEDENDDSIDIEKDKSEENDASQNIDEESNEISSSFNNIEDTDDKSDDEVDIDEYEEEPEDEIEEEPEEDVIEESEEDVVRVCCKRYI